MGRLDRLALLDPRPAGERPALCRARNRNRAARAGHPGAGKPWIRRGARSRSCPPGWCCRTLPACPASWTWPPCATRWPRMGGDPDRINPVVPCDLVIDHSVQVDHYGSDRRVPPQRGARVRPERRALPAAQVRPARLRELPRRAAGHGHRAPGEPRVPRASWCSCASSTASSPPTPTRCVGTDSHTTMINGLGVLGWGVGGIEAEAVMLGQPYFMLIPDVVGMKLTGELPLGTTATDLVLTATQMLRKKGVVDKFVEFYGPGLSSLGLADRATIANMAPEYGATMGFFPVDDETIRYLERTGRDAHTVRMAEALLQGAGALPHRRHARPGVHRDARARPLHGEVEHGRPQAPAGPGAARRAQAQLLRQPAVADESQDPGGAARGRRGGVFTLDGRGGRQRDDRPSRDRHRGPAAPGGMRARRRAVSPAGRIGRHRRHHQLHQHLQSLGDDRRRPPGKEGDREGAAHRSPGSRRAWPPARAW